MAGAAAAVGLGGEAAAVPASRPATALREDPQLPDRIAFHGQHQAGIVTPQQLFAGFVGFDVLAENRERLSELLQRLTKRSRILAAGVKPQDELVAKEAPTPDSLTITVGVGASSSTTGSGSPGTSPGISRPCRPSPTTGWSRPAATVICRCRSAPSTPTRSSMCCAI